MMISPAENAGYVVVETGDRTVWHDRGESAKRVNAT